MKFFKKSKCPICFGEVFPDSVAPNYVVCDSCYNLASDKDGRKLEFYNTSMGGGYKAIYSDTEEEYLSHTCYISGVECEAKEHRMGGIEIKVKTPWWQDDKKDGFWDTVNLRLFYIQNLWKFTK